MNWKEVKDPDVGIEDGIGLVVVVITVVGGQVQSQGLLCLTKRRHVPSQAENTLLVDLTFYINLFDLSTLMHHNATKIV